MASFADEARIAFDNLADRTSDFFHPTVRLGVTGLSRAGKTVFISALVHNLLHGGRLPLFSVHAENRIGRAYLEEQPDDAVPRFQYEDHIRRLLDERDWPNSTRAISELRLTVEFQSASGWSRMFSSGKLSIDIVDYPGEWLLDLPLIDKSFADFSRESIARARLPGRRDIAGAFLEMIDAVDPKSPMDDPTAQRLSRAFSAYLTAARADNTALSTLPPGRFLMPGDLEGSPALTFAPLSAAKGEPFPKGSLGAILEKRYEAYKSIVVKPFFREHFARLDRQILLVDALQAINAGPEAVRDLEIALSDILRCFRPGRSSWLGSLLSRRIDRILVAATKADHLHRESHRRLEAIVRRLVEGAVKRADFSGADTQVIAMAAIRATREARIEDNGDDLPVIVGVPQAGETIGRETFDGKTETAVFPGDLPKDPTPLFMDADGHAKRADPIRFVRFRPPKLERTEEGLTLSLPHIRLDRALEFLLGDRLR
ncbi:hypothetical protein FP2506_08891 [Fulvimarina pelagi HTCC2506]|uniref:Amino acid regulated cytosolic protein n=1 Tax=Fulvimarina pelagi HTCC2506 TaxID=314231 RepID=Q0G5W8_9HYPH|nr:YcjX family protein [Fulvimarina pelagi]EAU42946.1 hypothetical protein FP2506_08891 [Fulvimarina pelagi HTCC2506]